MTTSSSTATAGFARVPNWILDDPEIRSTDKLVLIALYRFAYGNKRKVHPSQKTLAQRLGMTRETVRIALEHLVGKELIRRVGATGRGKVATYELLDRAIDGGKAVKVVGGESVFNVADKPSLDGGTDVINNTVQILKNNTPATNSNCAIEHGSEVKANDPILHGDPRFESEAIAEAMRLGLEWRCPDDWDAAFHDINECVFIADGGELFNPGSLEALIKEYGIIRCWSQAKVLHERLQRSLEPVRKVTPYYIDCVKKNAGKPTGPLRVDTSDDYDIPF